MKRLRIRRWDGDFQGEEIAVKNNGAIFAKTDIYISKRFKASFGIQISFCIEETKTKTPFLTQMKEPGVLSIDSTACFYLRQIIFVLMDPL